MKNSKSLVLLVITLFVFSLLASCSSKKVDYEAEILEYTNTVFEGLFNDFENTLINNSISEFDLPEVTDEQRELIEYSYSGVTSKIDSVSFDEENMTATVTVTFIGVKEYDNKQTHIATVADYKELIDLFTGTNQPVTFNLVYDDNNKEWKFKDINKLITLFYNSYLELCVLDTEGNPINVNKYYVSYIESFIMASYWYDVYFANPLVDNIVKNVYALQNVVYFKELMSGDFVAELICGDEVVKTINVHLEDDIVAVCDFPNDSLYEEGTYKAILKYNDYVINESSEIFVK